MNISHIEVEIVVKAIDRRNAVADKFSSVFTSHSNRARRWLNEALGPEESLKLIQMLEKLAATPDPYESPVRDSNPELQGSKAEGERMGAGIQSTLFGENSQ